MAAAGWHALESISSETERLWKPQLFAVRRQNNIAWLNASLAAAHFCSHLGYQTPG